jgi:hypothetical protein
MVFFAGPPTPEHNVWSKYQIATTWQDALRIAQRAYYAKTGWLVLLLVLLVFNAPGGFASGLSYAFYATAMLIFFGFNTSTTIYTVGAALLLASYFVKWRSSGGRHGNGVERKNG